MLPTGQGTSSCIFCNFPADHCSYFSKVTPVKSVLQACHTQLSHHYQNKKVPQAPLLRAHLSYSVFLPLPTSCPDLLLNLHPWIFSFFYDFLENVTIGSTVLLKPMYIYFPCWPIVFSSEQEFNIVQHPVCRNTLTIIFYLPPRITQCPNAIVLYCIHELFLCRWCGSAANE